MQGPESQELIPDAWGTPVPRWLWDVLVRAVPADTGECWAVGKWPTDAPSRERFLALWETEVHAVTVSQTHVYGKGNRFRQIPLKPTDPRLPRAHWIPEQGDPLDNEE